MLISRIFINKSKIPVLFFIRNKSTKARYLKKRMELEENKAYIWTHTDGFEFHVTYKNAELNLVKHLKFSRDISDDLNKFLCRISKKITDTIEAVHKQKRRKDKSKNSNDDNNENYTSENIDVQLIENDKRIIDNKTCKEIFFDKQNNETSMFLKIANDVYAININLPVIRNIVMPKYMMTGFLVYPKKIEGMFLNIEECDCHWYRALENVPEDTPVGNEYLYTPKSDDIGYQLKLVLTPKYNGITGPSSHIISHQTIEVGPGICPFERRQAFTPCVLSGKSFRVVTYNILASVYTDTDVGKSMFENCPEYAISLSYRKLLLLKEILGYNADLICLQEVDETLFQRDLSLILSQKNLEGTFLKKGGSTKEGIAVFFRNTRFRILDNKEYALGTDLRNMNCLKSIWDVVTKYEAVTTRFTDRTTVFQVITLQHIETGNIFLLANTHLYFHPNADHIRLLQGGMCIYIITDMIQKLKQNNANKTVSVIFCGDFNSTPDSGIYELFTKNEVPANHFVWSQKTDETIAGLSLNQPLNLDSACGTPEFTHYTSLFRGCLDYIFYDKDNMEVEQVIPLPDTNEISSYNGLPNPVFPSDHIALVADLRWR